MPADAGGKVYFFEVEIRERFVGNKCRLFVGLSKGVERSTVVEKHLGEAEGSVAVDLAVALDLEKEGWEEGEASGSPRVGEEAWFWRGGTSKTAGRATAGNSRSKCRTFESMR